MSGIALEVRNLDFYYGAAKALEGVGFAVPTGTITALIGPSGCGKSTLLRTMNLMHRLYPGQRATGSITVEGRELLEADVDPIAVRARVGMVFQKPTPFSMSIFDNVAFGIRLAERLGRRAMEERVEEALRAAALWDEVKDGLRASALSLSGGQQQRLCIARALGPRPSVLLMDEPTSALDPIATARIEDLMNGLRQRCTMIIVTHSMQQAARVSDRTAFMYLGKLVEEGSTREFFVKPSTQLGQDYVTGRFG